MDRHEYAEKELEIFKRMIMAATEDVFPFCHLRIGNLSVLEKNLRFQTQLRKSLVELAEGCYMNMISLMCPTVTGNEVVTYEYPEGYKKAKPLFEQFQILGRFFPELETFKGEMPNQVATDLHEGYFAVPRWEKVASTYSEAVLKVLAKLDKISPILNLRGEDFIKRNLNQTNHTSECLARIQESQAFSDFLLLPAQFGAKHFRAARSDIKWRSDREFGLGVFETGCMLLTHPERLPTKYPRQILGVDCPGDLCKHDYYSLRVCWNLHAGQMIFHADLDNYHVGRFGMATGFLLD